MTFLSLGCVILLYFSENIVSRDILNALQVKFHERGIPTVVSEYYSDSYSDCYGYTNLSKTSMFYDDVFSTFFNKMRNKRASFLSLWEADFKSVYVLVYNAHVRPDLKLKITNSTQLMFGKNSFYYCNEDDPKACDKFTFRGYSPKKSLKGETFYIAFDKRSDVQYKFHGREIVPAHYKFVLLLQEKLKFKLEVFILEADVFGTAAHMLKSNSMKYNTIKLLEDYKETALLACEPDLILVVRKPSLLDKTTALFKPFSWKVWLAMLISFLVELIILFMITIVEGRVRNENHPTFQESFWLMYRIILRQDMDLQLPGRISRISFLMWMMKSFILTSAYCGLILSSLAYPGVEKIPSTYEEVVKAEKEGTFSIGTVRNNYIYEASSVLSEETLEKLFYIPVGSKLYQEGGDRQESNLVDTTEEGLERVLNENYVLLVSNYDFHTASVQHGNFHQIARVTDVGKCGTLKVSYSSPFKEEIRKTVIRMFEGGFFSKFGREEDEDQKRSREFYSEVKIEGDQPLLMEDLKLPLCILIAGQLLAIVVCIAENILSKFGFAK